MNDAHIPYSELSIDAEGTGHIVFASAPDIDVLSALLMRVVTDHVAREADAENLRLTSMTMDLTVTKQSYHGGFSFHPKIDKRTRTIAFAGGEVQSEAGVVMTVTAIYQL